MSEDLTLEELLDDPGPTACPLMLMIAELSEADQATFRRAIAEPKRYSHPKLSAALEVKLGRPVGRHRVGDHRRGACRCAG